jgi:hypothetical protein
MTMQPCRPMTIDQNKVRWNMVKDRVFNIQQVLAGREPQPGNCPECVFDFHDGLRVVMSRELTPDGERLFHASASAIPDSELYKRIAARNKNSSGMLREFLGRVEADVMTMTGRVITLAGFSEGKRVPHWYAEDEVTSPAPASLDDAAS